MRRSSFEPPKPRRRGVLTQSPAISCPRTPVVPREVGAQEPGARLRHHTGVSGFIYGLQVAASLIEAVTPNESCWDFRYLFQIYLPSGPRHPRLFGDGGAATIIAETRGRRHKDIRCGTAGRRYKTVLIPAGGMRIPRSAETSKEITEDHGNARTAEHTRWTAWGSSVFSIPRCRVRCGKLAAKRPHDRRRRLFRLSSGQQGRPGQPQSALGIPAEKMFGHRRDGKPDWSVHSRGLGSCDQSARETAAKSSVVGFRVGLSWGTAVLDL